MQDLCHSLARLIRSVVKYCGLHSVPHLFGECERILPRHPNARHLDRPNRVLRPILAGVPFEHPFDEGRELGPAQVLELIVLEDKALIVLREYNRLHSIQGGLEWPGYV